MKIVARLLLIFLLCSVGAQASLRTAVQARAALGPGIWTRLIRVENTNPRGVYPKVVYATVFEFAGLLWFYTDVNGTQSFSLHRGLLEAEKSDFGPLLRAIDSGFGAYEILPDASPAVSATTPPLLNGCFIESVVALRRLLGRNEPVAAAALLCYYTGTDVAASGHTVLAYETAAGLFVIDSALSRNPFKVRQGSLASEAVRVAQAVALESVRQARWLQVELTSERSPLTAGGALQLAALETGRSGSNRLR